MLKRYLSDFDKAWQRSCVVDYIWKIIDPKNETFLCFRTHQITQLLPSFSRLSIFIYNVECCYERHKTWTMMWVNFILFSSANFVFVTKIWEKEKVYFSSYFFIIQFTSSSFLYSPFETNRISNISIQSISFESVNEVIK